MYALSRLNDYLGEVLLLSASVTHVNHQYSQLSLEIYINFLLL